MNPVKTVSLVYGYSARNAGDFAITLGAIDVLLSFGIKVKLFSRYSRSNLDYHQALETLNITTCALRSMGNNNNLPILLRVDADCGNMITFLPFFCATCNV